MITVFITLSIRTFYGYVRGQLPKQLQHYVHWRWSDLGNLCLVSQDAYTYIEIRHENFCQSAAQKEHEAMKAVKAGSKRKTSAPSSSKTSKSRRNLEILARCKAHRQTKLAFRKKPASKKVANKPAAMKSKRKSRSLKALRKVTEAQSLRSFKSAVDHVVDINRLAVLHAEWLQRLVGWHSLDYPSCNKLEILLNAGLDVDTPGLLHSSVVPSVGSCRCFHMLLERGADPVGGPGDQTSGRCPFVNVVLTQHENLIQNLQALKEALMKHPRRQARHEEEWREAVERIHERLLQASEPRFFGRVKKWLRDQVLQYVDPKYAVSPPAPPAHCPEAPIDRDLLLLPFMWKNT